MLAGLHRLLATVVVLVSCVLGTTVKSRRPPLCDNQEEEQMSFLWTVKREPPSYFFGTIHVPYTRVWDYIPDNAKQAFEISEHVFFELDLMDPYTISALASCQLLPPGTNLEDVLPNDLYRRLKKHMEYVKGMMPSWMTSDQRGRGLYADYLFNAITGNWERKKPVWVMLMVNSLTESDVKSRGIPVLDLYLAQEAERMDKPTGAVERVEEQCVPLNGLNFSQVLFALNQTLCQHESIRSGDVHALYTTDDLIKHYNCGDLNADIFNHDTTQMPSLMNTSLPPEEVLLARNIDHYFREELVFKRNRRMGERVVELLLTHPDDSFFFAFGAGHFLGNSTVLDIVRAAGFQVDKIPVNKKVRGVKKLRIVRKGSVTSEHEVLTGFLPLSNDIQGAGEEDATGRGFHNRRRYRKRQNGVHHGVRVIRTTTAAPSRVPHRKFNDLWVRLDSFTRSSYLPRSNDEIDVKRVQESLRIWYGLENTSRTSMGSIPQKSLLGICCLLSIVWTLALWNHVGDQGS